MMVMLNDITSWLKEQDIPYFITYGTLLGAQSKDLNDFGDLWQTCWNSRCVPAQGAVREKDILPWTQAQN